MLLGNYSLLCKHPGRDLGGALQSILPCSMLKPTQRFGQYFGTVGSASYKKVAMPCGYGSSYCIAMPRIAGGIACHTLAIVSAPATGNLADGRNVAGTSTVVCTGGADGQLIALISGESNVACTGSGDAMELLWMSGESNVACTGAGDAAELGWISGESDVACTYSAVLTEYGWISGESVPYTELSPENLSRAVWAALVGPNHEAGTMGALLYAAGGGADPDTIAAAVWAALRTASIDPGTVGEALVELHRLSGLDPAMPLQVSEFYRRVPADGSAIDQTIETADGVTTVQRLE